MAISFQEKRLERVYSTYSYYRYYILTDEVQIIEMKTKETEMVLPI